MRERPPRRFPAGLRLARTAAAAAVAGAACWALPALAEPPMVTDDASTLDKGGAKVEFEWARQGGLRGWTTAVGYAPWTNVELELSLARLRDATLQPAMGLRGTGFAVKWVPLSVGRTAIGLKLERTDERDDGGNRARSTQLLGLLSHRYEAGPAVHVNLGRSWLRDPTGTSDSVTQWSLGAELPLGTRAALTADTFGETGSGAGHQLGLRFKVRDGLKLSAAAGRQFGQGTGRLVAAFEF